MSYMCNRFSILLILKTNYICYAFSNIHLRGKNLLVLYLGKLSKLKLITLD